VIVLGIDPGTAQTGYGVIRSGAREGDPSQASLVECGVIRTLPRDPLASRLLTIHEEVKALISRHRPDAMAVEDVFYAKNVRTTVVLGHARGVALLAGAQAGLDVLEFPPAEVKKAIVGTGAATKEQVQFMVTKLLRLKTAPQPSDAADGVAVALCCMLQPKALRASAISPDALDLVAGMRRSPVRR
jgi:crossover junction endodeoxyribonuclease RuvC